MRQYKYLIEGYVINEHSAREVSLISEVDTIKEVDEILAKMAKGGKVQRATVYTLERDVELRTRMPEGLRHDQH